MALEDAAKTGEHRSATAAAMYVARRIVKLLAASPARDRSA
jgi:hypothetical protein